MNNLKILDKAKFRMINKVFPFRRPGMLLLDSIELGIRETKINQIIIPAVLSPDIISDICLVNPSDITADFCPVKPEIVEVRTRAGYFKIITCQNIQCSQKLRIQIDKRSIGKQLKIMCTACQDVFIYDSTRDELIADLTPWINEKLFYPAIESFSTVLGMPRRGGKSYEQDKGEDKQPTLFEFQEDKECIHGLKKGSCSFCFQKERSDKEKGASIDPFDIIFPILQPPLGENFDSPIAFPPGMELYPFQREGIKFLLNNDQALLGDEMGLGKSIQAIVAIRFLIRMRKVTKGLVLCPKSVLTDWQKKLWDWAPELRVAKIYGPKEQRQIQWNTPAHVYLATYETLRQDQLETITKPWDKEPKTLLIDDKQEFKIEDYDRDISLEQFDFIILDEIQRIKNPGAAITKTIRQINAPVRWGLSGTPLENRLEELISIFAFLKPGLLHYTDAANPLRIKESIKQYFLRRRKKDALPELPEKVHEEAWLELLPIQREVYDRAEREGIVTLNEQGDSITVQHVLALITKLKQICNLDPVSMESCKFEYLLDKLEEICDQGEKALVFSQYPEKTLRFLEPELKQRQFGPVIYDGLLSSSQRDNITKAFQERDDYKTLLMSVKAGGVGLTLTRANYVYHFDLWWNPAIAAQAEDRAHRIGQKKTVFVSSLLTVGTIEEKIYNLLKRKRELFKEVIDDLSDAGLSKALTEEELFSLFNLKKGKQTTDRPSPVRKTAAASLNDYSPQQFEELISILYEKMGFQVRLTPKTRDKGVDIYAKRFSESGIESLAIQCKHYVNGVVGVEHARSLYGVIQDQPDITKGVLVTSGEFSKECREFTRGKRIELFDNNYICGLLEKYSVSLPEEGK